MDYNETDFIKLLVLSNNGHMGDDNLLVLTSEPTEGKFRKTESVIPQY